MVLLFVWVNIKIKPFITSVTKSYAENTVAATLNSILREQLQTHDYDFIDITYLPDGSVASVSLNAVETNLLRSALIESLKKEIAALDEQRIGIPLGNFLPNQFFSGLGPKIPVTFLILSNTSVKVAESFTSQGINQTLYTLSFQIETRVGIYIPTLSSSVNVETTIPIAQTIIVGKIPESYTSVDGVEDTPEDVVLNMLN
ncbi:MAG: sporulation protein YunB [Clostridia bacterium]|nr:sporulation protein YunB [Clostridia bacterium]